MPRKRLEFVAGVSTDASQDGARGTFADSNLIRFVVDPATKKVWPEKIGGWVHLPSVYVNPSVSGIARKVHFWTTLNGTSYFAIGTVGPGHLFIYPAGGGAGTDIGAGGVPPGSTALWSLDNFGEFLLALPINQTILLWVPGSAGVTGIPGPTYNRGMFVSDRIQIIVAYGCNVPGGPTADPMLVRWCAQSDYLDWIASTTNQAGSYRLSRGSRIMGGSSSIVGNLLWTDLDLWSMQYLGFPLVFGFTQVGRNCGLVSLNGHCVLNGIAYWMSDHQFYTYGPSGVQEIPCSVRDRVFNDIYEDGGTSWAFIIWAATNVLFNEVWWYYPSASGNPGSYAVTGIPPKVDSYVKYNTLAQVWDCGKLNRTAGTDDNKPGGPAWMDDQGLLQRHETGVNADGAPMTGVRLLSGFVDLDDGEFLASFQEFLPDFQWGESLAGSDHLRVRLFTKDMPSDEPFDTGEFVVTRATRYENPRGRGVDVAIEIRCDNLDCWFRMGVPRLNVMRDGKVS